MKNQVKISIAISKGYSSIVFIYKGKCIFHKVRKTKKVERGNPILKYMELLKEALILSQSLVRNPEYFNEDSWEDTTLLIDIRSDALVKMIINFNTTTKYKETFQSILALLDNIPLIYQVKNNGASVAVTYAKEKYIEKDLVFEPTSMDDFF